MKQQLLTQSVIHADETVVQVLREDGKAATSESRMWLYASGEYSNAPIRIFEYQPDRSGKRPESFLKGFAGCLVTDGYAGYNHVANVTHCGCRAHSRRKWREAKPDRATVKTSEAAVGVPVLLEAVFPGEEMHILRMKKPQELPPECGLAPSGGVFCVAEKTAF